MCASASRKPLNAILVDDEPVAIERLRKGLEVHPDITIIGTASDGLTAVKLINTQCPDLVFLDIHMPEINGFGVLSLLTHKPLIVFVTAYDEYAVTAFEKNSLDYLLKPVAAERLALTVQRAFERRNQSAQVFDQLNTLSLSQQKKNHISTIPVKTGHKIHLVPVGDICYFEAKDKYVFLHTYADEKLLDNTLNYLEERLPPEFIRVHRSYIINKHQIQEMQKYFKGGFVFIMNDKNGTRIKSSNSFNPDIRAKLLYL